MQLKRYVFFLALPLCLGTSHAARAAELLTIGSEAPALNVEHWLSLGNGKFQPVTKFEPGKVYVVEFWATWCGPCIASMPHLAELQKQYSDQGVQIISISDEDLATVERFLEREVRGGDAPSEGEDQQSEEAPTYKKLTSAYCLTTDPDQSSYEDYMLAAAQNGIPTSFVVGKQGRIEWIGHPMELDETLKQVVDGSWDREAFAEEFRARQEAEKERMEAQLALQEVISLLQQKDYEGALQMIDEKLADKENLQLRIIKLQVLLATQQTDKAKALLEDVYKARAESPGETNMIAWNLYEMSAQGNLQGDDLIDVSTSAVSAAIEKAEDAVTKASLMDTLAHFVFLKGELDQAIQVEEKAIELTTKESDREFFEDFLKELKAAKESKQNPASSPAEPEK